MIGVLGLVLVAGWCLVVAWLLAGGRGLWGVCALGVFGAGVGVGVGWFGWCGVVGECAGVGGVSCVLWACGWCSLSARVWGAPGVFGGCARAGAWWMCGCLRVWVCFWRASVVLCVCGSRG